MDLVVDEQCDVLPVGCPVEDLLEHIVSLDLVPDATRPTEFCVSRIENKHLFVSGF